MRLKSVDATPGDRRQAPSTPSPSTRFNPPGIGTAASGATEPLVSNPDSLSEMVDDDYAIWLQDPSTGEWLSYTYKSLVDAGYMPGGLAWIDVNYATHAAQQMVNDESSSSRSGTRRSGGGAVGQVYQRPDERLVREAVRSTLAALAGKVDEPFLETLVNTYMAEDKKSFDQRETQQLDPMETVKERIRATSEYKAIHQLRPESVDEMQWITSRQGALKRAGVTDATSESLGISQATAGASAQDATTAGNIATYSASGKQLDELKGRIRTAAYGALRLA